MMRTSKLRLLQTLLVAAAMVSFLAATAHARGGGGGGSKPAPGPTESVIHSFAGYATDGGNPEAGLVTDGAGNFYGTTLHGGSSLNHDTTLGDGAVFMRRPDGSESVIWNFGVGVDGWGPTFGNLIIDSSGNLYGTTAYGGANDIVLDKNGNPIINYVSGTVFELSPPASPSQAWTERVLWSFGGSGDGANPIGRLVLLNGNLFGTTANGGSGSGVAFELSPDGSGGWNETIIHEFAGGTDGSGPRDLIVDSSSGNLYGVTFQGGLYNWGTAFELSPTANTGDSWNYNVIWDFGNGLDGKQPMGNLITITDTTGTSLYGTTHLGGAYMAIGTSGCCGTVYRLTPQNNGGWVETILWSFGNPRKKGEGQEPEAGLLSDSAGNLYGTCSGGGSIGWGTAFKLVKPTSGSTWTESILWNFANGNDGSGPASDLLMDPTGKVLYGTTEGGGTSQSGTVFEITMP